MEIPLRHLWKHVVAMLSILCAFGLHAQKGEIKGRGVYITPWGRAFSLGLGYERPVSDNSSWQIVANRMGHDGMDNDGSSNIVSSLVPEYRWYLKKLMCGHIHRGAFVGVFNEFAFRRDRIPGNRMVFGPNDVLAMESRYMINPGVILGMKTMASKRSSIEFFAGCKYQFIHARRHYTHHDSDEYDAVNYSKFAWRVGINFCFALSRPESEPVSKNS